MVNLVNWFLQQFSIAWYRQNGLSIGIFPDYGVREEMWSVLLSRLLMYLRIIKNWLPLCRVCIFMMMAGTGWVGGEMGFAAISHCVPNILPIMMCCILLLFYMVIKYFVISWNMHSICETAKHSFSTLKCLQMNIISKCLCGFVLFLFIYLFIVSYSGTGYNSWWLLHPHKRASIAATSWLHSEDSIGLLMYKWLKQ